MKTAKKILSVLLVLVIVLSLSGCSPITITKAAKKMSDLKSLRADLDLDLDLSMNMMDEASDLDVKVTGPFDIDLAGGKGKGELSVNMMGEVLPILFYYEDTEDSYHFYVSPDGGATWTKNDAPKSEDSQTKSSGSTLKSIVELTKFAASFEEAGTETVKGTEAVLYTGRLQWSELIGDADLSGALASAGSAAGTDLDLSGLDLSNLGSIPVTIGFDEANSRVVKASMDLTETVNTLVPMVMKAVMKSVLEESGMSPEEMGEFDLSMLGIELDVHTLTLAAELYDFDAVGEIVIPQEALNAEAMPVGAAA